MPALMISEIRVKSPAKLVEYMDKTRALGARYGAEMVAQAAWDHGLTAEDRHDRVVIVKFPDMETLDSWYASEEYAALVPLREEASEMRMTAYALPA